MKDRYGLSRQVAPSLLVEMLDDPDPRKANNVRQAMMKMGKIDIKGLREADESEPIP